jgi:hypothetical protein
MEVAVQKIRDFYGLPGSGQEEYPATRLDYLPFPNSDVLQDPDAQDELIDLLADVVAAGRRDVFFTILLEHMPENDRTCIQHPIARILYMSPFHEKEFQEKVLDRLPSAWRAELDKYRYEVYSKTWWSLWITEYGIFVGELMSTS